ncbi:Na+/H+ antiporter subunit D [Patulibacter defluvii]|uniref:Na+/H+ antiporter subunit D n=1 Tax=Patulibacter defluvii TaxID=3095358 RepID=UPI002A765109|nr:Na+/H+ antiporter subunit D [Patulibacter sp. DM4]
MSVTSLVALPVILPLFAAGLKFAIGPRLPKLHRLISVGTLAAVLAIAVVLLVAADRDGPQVAAMGGWDPPLGITLVADRLSALMLVISASVTLCVLIYSYGQGTADEEEGLPLAVFHPTFLVLSAGVSNAFLAGDLFNLYVGFEILLVSSYVLITLGGTASRIRSGATYVVVSVLSSLLFLAAIGLVYGATGTINLADLASKLDGLDDGMRLILQLALLLAFGIKAAVFPVSAWLPDSYPTAPAPVTAVFAGLLTKVGVYAVIRTETLLFPDGRVDSVLLVVALLTMVVGILGAVAQTDIKRMLSFTLVSHIGYMVFGIALSSQLGLAGAVFYVVHHITIQTTLFLTTGMIERRAGSTSTERIGGLAKTAPLVAILFFLPAMNLAGIPPFSGFLGKLALIQAGVVDGTALAWILVAGSVLTSLLTLYAVGKVWSRVFWRAPRVALRGPDGAVVHGTDEAGAAEADRDRGGAGIGGEVVGATLSGRAITTSSAMPKAMTGATVALVALGLAFTFAAGPLAALSDRAAEELRDRSVYVTAVDQREAR